MALNTFVERTAQVIVTVQRPDSQGKVTPQTYTFEQNRMTIRVRDGGAQFGNAHLQIYGVPLADMNNIARLYLMPLTPQNTDTVKVNVWNGYQFVPFFEGVVSWSAISPSGIPTVALVIEANSSFLAMNTPASPYSNSTPVSLQSALETIANQADLTVDYSPQAPQYTFARGRLVGSVMDQINALMRYFPDLVYNVHLQRLIVRAANSPNNSTADDVVIGPDTGAQPPEYSTNGVTFATLFNPQLVPGTAIRFNTQFTYLNQTRWVVSVLQHEIEPNVFNGKWTSSVAASAYGPTGNAQ